MSIVPQSTNGMLKYLKKQKSPKKFKLLRAVIMWFSSIGSHVSQQTHANVLSGLFAFAHKKASCYGRIDKSYSIITGSLRREGIDAVFGLEFLPQRMISSPGDLHSLCYQICPNIFQTGMLNTKPSRFKSR